MTRRTLVLAIILGLLDALVFVLFFVGLTFAIEAVQA